MQNSKFLIGVVSNDHELVGEHFSLDLGSFSTHNRGSEILIPKFTLKSVWKISLISDRFFAFLRLVGSSCIFPGDSCEIPVKIKSGKVQKD